MKRYLVLLMMILLMAMSAPSPAVFAGGEGFIDVPKGDWSEVYIYQLKELNITTGKGKGVFGYNEYITRGEFLTFLIRTLDIDTDIPRAAQSFADVKTYHWYAPFVNAGLSKEIILMDEYPGERFVPNQFITREEMAVMIIRALDYEYLAKLIEPQPSRFDDVKNYKGHIALAKDLGIINGKSERLFVPRDNALRQEAAAMLIRMYNALNYRVGDLNGFYAIDSYSQIDKTSVFDTVSYGWSRIQYSPKSGQVELTTGLSASDYPFYIPEGYQKAIDEADENGVEKYLMVFGTNEEVIEADEERIGIISRLLGDAKATQNLIESVSKQVYDGQQDELAIGFDGVVIDFEALRDVKNDKAQFVSFLAALKEELKKGNKKLVVCVHPKREPGQRFFDGYDYKQIGEIADKVILMAHDYAPHRLKESEKAFFTGDTPLAPIKDIYYALRYATDKEQGIPRDKLLLQVSFDTVQWQFQNGEIMNDTAYHPTYDIVKERMKDHLVRNKEINYSTVSQTPYFVFEERNKRIRNIIWYEDARSIQAKIDLANMFGLRGISVWRLGSIPDFEDSKSQRQSHYLNVWPLFEDIKNKR